MNAPGAAERWRTRVAALERDAYALWLAARDPRVAWYAKAVAALTVCYALSPIDLVPDFIPVLGQLDDLLLVPLGLMIAIRLIPAPILAEHRAAAARRFAADGPRSRAGAALVLLIWLVAAAATAHLGWRLASRH